MAKIIRLSSVIGCFIFAIIKLVQNNRAGGAALFFAGIIILFSHYKSASIPAVVNYVKRGDFSRAKKVLLETPNVNWLTKGNKGYYYWCNAYIKINENDIENVESDLLKSLEYGIKDSDDEAMANASLAELYIHEGNKIKAEEYLDKALEISKREGLNKKLEALKKAL